MHRKVMLCLIVCLTAITIALRVVVVNSGAPVVPETVSKVGERVDLNGSFSGQSIEQTKGLSVTVTQAEIMSKSEYLARYSASGENYTPPPIEHWESGKNVACVTVELYNRDNETGYFALLNWRLVSPDGADAYMMNSNLLMIAEPQFRSTGSAGYAKLNPGKSYALHIPFCRQDKVLLGGLSDFEFKVVSKGRYRLLLTSYPQKKTVEIDM